MKRIKIALVALIATVGLVSTFAFTTKPFAFTTKYFNYDETNVSSALLNSLQPIELSDQSFWIPASNPVAGNGTNTKLEGMQFNEENAGTVDGPQGNALVMAEALAFITADYNTSTGAFASASTAYTITVGVSPSTQIQLYKK